MIWLIAAGAVGSAEAVSGDFVLIMCSAGAATGAVTAAVGAPGVLQIVVATAVALALVLFLRPVAKRHLITGSGHQTGSAALVGKPAVVILPVDDRDGRVRLNGQEWSARSFGGGQIYAAGTAVRVMQICGATAVVYDETFTS